MGTVRTASPAPGSGIPLPRQHPGLREGTVRHKCHRQLLEGVWVCAPFTTLTERQPQPSFPPSQPFHQWVSGGPPGAASVSG